MKNLSFPHVYVGIALMVLISKLAVAAEPERLGNTQYTCPMHPHYIADEMGTCPICGMDLVALQSGPKTFAAPGDRAERAAIQVPAETVQNMGVRYGKVEHATFGRRIRAYGVVAENERVRSEVSSRVSGWIDSLAVTAVGDPVKRGDEVFRLFSPDLITAQRDYLSAVERNSQPRIDASALRLRALGVSETLLKQLRRRGRVMETVPFYANATGTVSVLNVREGAFVRPGETLAVIQDYSQVWINAAVAEKDMPSLDADTPVNVALPNLPGRLIETRIDYIHPTVDATSRTGRVRMAVDNAAGLLRPGAYADIVFEAARDQRLAVPDSALLMSAEGTYVVVALGEGRFQPQRVRTGLSGGGFTEVLEGVALGDRIVVSGQFLLDSESALREAFDKLARLKQDLPDLTLSRMQMAMVDHLVDAGLYIHEALVDGYDVIPLQLQPAREIRDMLWPVYGQTRLGPVLDNARAAVARAQAARTETQLQNALDALVKALQPWVLEGKPAYYREKDVRLYQDADDGRLWLQLGQQAYNPYGQSAGEWVQ